MIVELRRHRIVVSHMGVSFFSSSLAGVTEMVSWGVEEEQAENRDEKNGQKKRTFWRSLKKLTQQVYLKRGKKARGTQLFL